jgi:hypothetical protein
VTTTALRGIVSRLNLGPLLGFKVKAEKVVEGNSLIVDTTMATEKINLSVEESRAGVCSRGGSIRDGVLVLGGGSRFAISALPGKSIYCKEPSIIETDLRRGVTTEHEDLVLLRSSDSDVLSSCGWNLVATELLLVPSDLIY